MDEVISGSQFKETHGLATFFSHVDPDELLATSELIFLPTLINNGSVVSIAFDNIYIDKTCN